MDIVLHRFRCGEISKDTQKNDNKEGAGKFDTDAEIVKPLHDYLSI
jgi:hypothetical protein